MTMEISHCTFCLCKLLWVFAVLMASFSNVFAQQIPQTLFRDWVRDPSVSKQWNYPASPMSQATAPATFTAPALALSATTQFDDRISNHIAKTILQFARNITLQLDFNGSEVFSPLSLMACLAYLMLGAKGSTHIQLKQLFAVDELPELQANPSRFYQELAYLLEDAQQHNVNRERMRETAQWRNTMSVEYMRSPNSGSNDNFDHAVKIANGIFVQMGFSLNPDYSYVIRSIYHSELKPLDFRTDSAGARKHINDWVNRNTLGKIKEIVHTENEIRNAQVIIANTIYFKGFWEYSFYPTATRDAAFYPDGLQGPSIQITMMATGGVFPFYASEKFNCRVIGLPYRDNTTTMYIIQPNDSSRTKLRQLQSELSAADIEDLIANMKRTIAVVALPKMHFARSYRMAPLLTRLGLSELFDTRQSDLSLIGNNVQSNQLLSTSINGLEPEALETPVKYTRPFFIERHNEKPLIFSSRIDVPQDSANNMTKVDEQETSTKSESIQKIKRQTKVVPLIDRQQRSRYSLQQLESQRYFDTSKKGDIFVDEILHSVDIVINEEGTEAAAATVVTLKKSTQILFRAETPFLFLIRHDPTKLVLFYGAVNKPEK